MASHRSSSEDSNSGVEPTENTEFTNIFRNDGSFLEMFKKMQNTSQSFGNSEQTSTTKCNEPAQKIKKEEKEKLSAVPKQVPLVGRRRCNKALPVGKVKKLKTDDEGSKPTSTDAWAKYLDEVKKYKETYCDSEAKNRSLVK